jgi:hypothetical protein
VVGVGERVLAHVIVSLEGQAAGSGQLLHLIMHMTPGALHGMTLCQKMFQASEHWCMYSFLMSFCISKYSFEEELVKVTTTTASQVDWQSGKALGPKRTYCHHLHST